MILQTIGIFCCVFLQQVTAEYYNTTIWDSFEWKITVQRQRQDKITLNGLHDDWMPLEEVKIPGANCSNSRKLKKSRRTHISRFIMRCTCNLDSSTFVLKSMSCVANSYVKQGSQFTSGSWRWSTGWKWDSTDHALLVLDNKRDYGIATGFNATTTEYHSCSVTSLSYWEANMKWIEESDSFLTDSKPVMFKLHNMWHFSWIVKKMKAEVKESLKGKVLKFRIECEKPGPPEDEDEELELTSWLLVKVSGELNFSSKYWEASQNTTATARTTHTSNRQHILLIALLTPLALILLIVGVFTAICYIRRTACFVERDSLYHITDTVVDDDVVQTKLITNHADESVV